MAVIGCDAVAQDMTSPFEPRRQGDLEHSVQCLDGKTTVGASLGVGQADDQGRYGFVEAQDDGGRRAFDGGAVLGMGLDQCRMGKGVAAAQHGERQPEHDEDRALHGGTGSRVTAPRSLRQWVALAGRSFSPGAGCS